MSHFHEPHENTDKDSIIINADVEELREKSEQAVGLLKVLSNPDRLLLLCQLVSGEKSVTELEGLTGLRQPSLSQQLGVLRKEALVSTRRDGKWIYYSLASHEAAAILQTLHGLFCALPEKSALGSSNK